jgi:hypothetical protein
MDYLGPMAEGFLKAAEEAEKVLPAGEKARLAEEIMRAVRAERMRKRKEFLEWISTSPLQGQGHVLREAHEEFKQGFLFQSDRQESDE